MATQYSDLLRVALPTQGELTGTWGDVVNEELTKLLEQAIAGLVVIDTWVGNSHTLTEINGSESEARAAILDLTDTTTDLTADAQLICPASSKLYVVRNNTGQRVTVKTPSGTGVDVPDGKNSFVMCDGVNIIEVVELTGSASETEAGTLEIATNAEALAGTNDTKAMTPLKTKQSYGQFGLGAENVSFQTFSTAGDWYKPAGFRCVVNQASTGLPVANFHYYHVISTADAGTGYSAILVELNTNKVYFGNSVNSATLPTFSEAWTTDNLVKTTSATDTTTGRMLQVGDFGLGGDAPDFSGNIDDTTLGGGVYYVRSNASGTRPNSSSAFGYLRVNKEDPAGITVFQEWTDNTSNRIFVRYHLIDTWSNWAEIYSTDSPNVAIQRRSASFTLTRNAPVIKIYWITGTSGTITLSTGTFQTNDVIEVYKQQQAGDVNITTSNGTIFVPDGSSDTTQTLNSGFAFSFKMQFDGINWRGLV